MFSLLARYGHNKNIFYVFFFFFFSRLGQVSTRIHRRRTHTHSLAFSLSPRRQTLHVHVFYNRTKSNTFNTTSTYVRIYFCHTFLSPRNGYLTVDLLLLLSSLMRYVLQCAYFLELRNIEHNFETTQKVKYAQHGWLIVNGNRVLYATGLEKSSN